MSPIRVVVVDDHPIVRAGVAAILRRETDIELVGQAGDADAAWRLVREQKPHVALVDIDLGVVDGLSLISTLRSEPSPPRVLVFSALEQEAVIDHALRMNVSGYLLKTEPPERLAHAIREVARGDYYFSPTIQARLVIGEVGIMLESRCKPRVSSLTHREIEVVRLLGRGMSVKQAAARLSLSDKTFGDHMTRAMAKLGVHNHAELILISLKEGILPSFAAGGRVSDAAR